MRTSRNSIRVTCGNPSKKTEKDGHVAVSDRGARDKDEVECLGKRFESMVVPNTVPAIVGGRKKRGVTFEDRRRDKANDGAFFLPVQPQCASSFVSLQMSVLRNGLRLTDSCRRYGEAGKRTGQHRQACTSSRKRRFSSVCCE